VQTTKQIEVHQRRKRIKQLAAAGLNNSQIAEEVGITPSCVRHHRNWDDEKALKARIKAKEDRRLARGLWDAGLTMPQIQAELGMTETAVRRCIDNMMRCVARGKEDKTRHVCTNNKIGDVGVSGFDGGFYAPLWGQL